jgi:hypothetical protein
MLLWRRGGAAKSLSAGMRNWHSNDDKLGTDPERSAETLWPPKLGGDRRFGVSGSVPARNRDDCRRYEQATVVERALDILRQCEHVRPAICTDEELRFVPEEDAPGVTLYRNQLAHLLSGYEASSLPHEEIIAMLDRVGETFRVLLIKTKMRIPYTSVFVELRCGYWNVRAENRLRALIRSEYRKRHARKRSQKDKG